MTDQANSNPDPRVDAFATGLISHLGFLREAILSQAKIPVPPMRECLSDLQGLFSAGPGNLSKISKDGRAITDEDAKYLKKMLTDSLSLGAVGKNRFKGLKDESVPLLAKHASSMAKILFYAQCMQEAEAEKNQGLVEKYKKLYIQEQKDLVDKLGNEKFAGLMHDLMSASETKGNKHFGMLFHAACYIEPEFQHIADIANTLNLTNLAKSGMPKQIKMAANLFGSEREYNAIEMASKLGHILLPADPTKDNTIYIHCPGLEQLAKNPAQILAQIQSGGGLALFNQLQAELLKLENLSPDWKANIKVVGDNMGAKIAQEYFAAIQNGLHGQLEAVPELLKQQAISHIVGKAQEMAQKAGLGGGVEMLGKLGGVQNLSQHVGSLNFENVQTSPLLDPQFRAANPKYDKFLTDAKIPQSLGVAGLAVGLARDLGLDELVNSADQELRQYHKYRAVRPGLKFIAENAMPALGMVMTGAAIGTAIPGIGTGVGALIGLGAAVAVVTFKGYALWKERKQMKLEKEAKKQGIEVHAPPYQALGALPSPNPQVRFSSSEGIGPKRGREESGFRYDGPPSKRPRPDNKN